MSFALAVIPSPPITFKVGLTVEVPLCVIPVPAVTEVTVPSNWSFDVTVNVLPDLVTEDVPAPTINTLSRVPSEPSSCTPAVPFVEPTPNNSYVVSVPAGTVTVFMLTAVICPCALDVTESTTGNVLLLKEEVVSVLDTLSCVTDIVVLPA